MKRLTKLISMLLVLSFAVLLCVGCDGKDTDNAQADIDENIATELSEADKINATNRCHFNVMYVNEDFPTKIITSYPELVRYLDEEGYTVYDKNSSYYNTSVGEQIRSYDADYFEVNAVILISGYEKSNACEQVWRIDVINNSINISLQLDSDNVYAKDAFFPIEISKEGKTIGSNEYTIDEDTEVRITTFLNGGMVSLIKAYESGMLTSADIANIAYYSNGGKVYQGDFTIDEEITIEDFVETDFIPMPLNPTELSEETICSLQGALADSLLTIAFTTDMTGNGLYVDPQRNNFMGYYGTYNGYTAYRAGYDYTCCGFEPFQLAGSVFMWDSMGFYLQDMSKFETNFNTDNFYIDYNENI